MFKSKAVIGLGFGDEGKGLVTDYLCSHSPNDSLVVRFNGGHQAGHTVVHNGVRHVFSSFGSGALRGVPTYWSRFCTVYPNAFLNELESLVKNKIFPVIYIDERCPITTPYDVAYNKDTEEKKQYGSVGVGFGATIEREQNFYSLTFGDLLYPKVLKAKLLSIAEYYMDKNIFVNFKNHIKPFLDNCQKLRGSIFIKPTLGFPKRDFSLESWQNLIFEGAQGLLLDQHYGFYPSVTWSNTGTKNLLVEFPNIDFELFLVTRAYQTRHGNGFMTNQEIPHSIKDNPLETNKPNTYQGNFRKSILDLSLLEYAIKKDAYIRLNEKNLVITCLDHIENSYKFTYYDRIIECDSENDFIRKIKNVLKVKKVYVSRGDKAEDIAEFLPLTI